MITLIRGDDQTFNLTFTDADGVAINITGYTVFFTVKKEDDLDDAGDTKALISKTVTVHSDPTAGKTSFSITDTESGAIPAGEYFYDLQLKDTSGNIQSVEKDKFKIVKDVTRRTT